MQKISLKRFFMNQKYFKFSLHHPLFKIINFKLIQIPLGIDQSALKLGNKKVDFNRNNTKSTDLNQYLN